MPRRPRLLSPTKSAYVLEQLQPDMQKFEQEYGFDVRLWEFGSAVSEEARARGPRRPHSALMGLSVFLQKTAMTLSKYDRASRKRQPVLWGLALLVLLLSAPGQAVTLDLADGELEWVGQQVFRNECGGRQRCLVHWNEGEAFPSLGIGHFIWYPANTTGPFQESFPNLVMFLKQRGADLPDWLARLEPMAAPWPDRSTFQAVEHSDQRIHDLRQFLIDHQGLQVAFMFQRAQRALSAIIAASEMPAQTRRKLALLASTPGGTYALIDYVNFKGEGLAATERYQGEGWGLLQVIEAMPGPASAAVAVEFFRDAAAKVLSRRSELAERSIERERWLPGWLKRVDTYRQPEEAP